jgi:hypothetical protein
MTQAEIYFAKLTEQIPGAKAGKMFGSLCMKMSNGKSAAMFWKDSIVAKLNGKDFDEAMRLSGAKLFEPMEGRKMKEWIQIPFTHKSRWKEFAEISAHSVEIIRKKTSGK